MFYFCSCIFENKVKDKSGFSGVEKIFSILMFLIVCVMVFVYGLNDVVNVIGLFVVVEVIIR